MTPSCSAHRLICSWSVLAGKNSTKSLALMRAVFCSDRRWHTNFALDSFQFEYGDAEVEMHTDALTKGERVVLVDDLLATGGTSAAAAILIRNTGANLLEAQFLIELEFLEGRKRIEPTPVTSFLKYCT